MTPTSANFVDSNVILYLASSDARKAACAEAVLARDAVVSVQVLNEIANVCRRKMRLDWNEVRLFLEPVRQLARVVSLTEAMHEQGLLLCARYGLSIYDSMIAAAALLAECNTLYSEDMQDGLLIERRVRVVNPF